MFRAYTSIRSGVLQSKARMCMQVHMRWLSMRLGGQVYRRGLYCTRTCGRRRNMRGLSSSEFGAWFSSGCGIPSCKIYLCCKMYLCACLWVLGSCRGHLVGVDNCCDVGCILGKWQFGSHEVCKWLLIWGVITYYVCVGTCNDLCEALAQQGTCHAPMCRFEICILLFCLACFFCRSESRSEWVACKMELLQVRVALVPINCEQWSFG